MSRSKLIVASLFCLVAITPFVWSQNTASAPPAPGIPGSLNPTTHVFTARPASAAAVTPATTTNVIARYVISFSFMYNDGGNTSCAASIYTDDSAGTYLYETASDGGNATSCTVTILFQWGLATPGSSHIYVEPSVSTTGGANNNRETELATITEAVPSNGSTTTIPVSGIVF